MIRLLHLLTRRLGPVGVALMAYDVWRALSPEQRQRLLSHGRALASRARARERLDRLRASQGADERPPEH